MTKQKSLENISDGDESLVLKRSYLIPKGARGCKLEVIFEPSFAGQSESLECPSSQSNDSLKTEEDMMQLDDAFLIDGSEMKLGEVSSSHE